MSRDSVVQLVKLSDAARRLGCHVETLRERARSGRLPVVRGAHGAYFVAADALVGIRVGRPGRPQLAGKPITRKLRNASWRALDLLFVREDINVSLVEFQVAEIVRRNPKRALDIYHLLSVHGLRAERASWPAIAGELDISVRHARRLGAKPLLRTLRLAIVRLLIRHHRQRRYRRAHDLIDVLRERLRAEGVPSALGPYKRHKLTTYEARGLEDAGLTDEEIEAVRVEGMTFDELNELLLRGLRGPTPASAQRRALSRR